MNGLPSNIAGVARDSDRKSRSGGPLGSFMSGLGQSISSMAGMVSEGMEQAGFSPQPGPPPATQDPVGIGDWADQTMPGLGEAAGMAVTNRFLNNQSPLGVLWPKLNRAMSSPTYSEDFIRKMSGYAMEPGIGQQNVAQTLSAGGPTQANEAWEMFLGSRPEISADAGLGPYYEDAKRRALEDIRQSSAARGVYGSSAAVDAEQEAISSLEAQRANREADYRLRTLGEQRAWDTLMGQLGSSAAGQDLSSMLGLGNLGLSSEGMDLNRLLGATSAAARQGGLEQSRLGMIGQLAGMASGDEINRLMGASTASTGAQNLRDSRIQNAFLNMLGLGGQIFEPTLGYQGDTVSLDASTLNAINNALLGKTGAGVAQSQNEAAKNEKGLANIFELVGIGQGGDGGGGGGDGASEAGNLASIVSFLGG